MSSRPSIQARDSSGRRVSLLNDEPSTSKTILPIRTQDYPSYHYSNMVRSSSRESAPSNMSSPLTPGLTRADSFDSDMGPFSPPTPGLTAEHTRQNSYTHSYKDPTPYEYTHHGEYPSAPMYGVPTRSPYGGDSRSPPGSEPHMYEDDGYAGSSSSDRGGKRYPCRFRDSHSCSKTFTTSGHASRHSKIHTAEKGVHCTYEGCPKKFTRADNMKQHLETHNKDKSSKTKITSSLTRPSGIRKASSISRPSSRNTSFADQPPVDPALISHGYQNQTQTYHTLANPSYGVPLTKSPPMTSPYQGLDVLAAAADFTTHS